MEKKIKEFNFELTMNDGSKKVVIEKGLDMYEAFHKVQDKVENIKSYLLV